MFKRIGLAVLAVLAFEFGDPLSVRAATFASLASSAVTGFYENLTFATEFGVGVPMNDDLFQQDYKEAIYGGQRLELYLYRGVSIHVRYSSGTYDVVAGADPSSQPIDASQWSYGAMVQGDLNASGSVIGYLELGLQKSISPTEPDEWQFWPGPGFRAYLTPSRKTAIDLGVRFTTLGDQPKVQEFLPHIAFCVSPGKL